VVVRHTLAARGDRRGALGGGVDYRVRGVEHLPGAEDMRRVILVSKHQSTWETFFFPSMTPHPLSYVLKKELLRIPIFGWCMGAGNGAHRSLPALRGLDAGRHAGRGS
jgi:hypothetical protein